jgi:hypothetical protein
MPLDADDVARTALADLVPRQHYRLAGLTDARFAAFAGDVVRVAFQHLGPRPSLVLFSGPGQRPEEAARRAAEWAAASWQPTAIQRRVAPSVVVVQVADRSELAPAGPVEGAAVPAMIWTVDRDRGTVEAPAGLPGGPRAGSVRRAVGDLMAGRPAVPIGVLGAAERELMKGGSRALSGAVVPGIVGLVLVLVGIRLALNVLGDVTGQHWSALPRDAILLLGVIGAGLLLSDYGGLRARLPGFSSRRRWVALLSWAGYVAAVVVVAAVAGFVVPPPS